MDNLVGTAGDDTFSGVLATGGTWTVGDQIDGGAGNDTFNVTVAAGGTALPAGASVKNFETVNITYADATTITAGLNSSRFVGVKQLWQIDNDATAINFANLTVGSDVTAGFRSNGTVGANSSVTAAAGVTDVSIALDGVLGGGLAISETTANSVSSVTVSGSVAATTATPPVNAFFLTANAADVDTLNVSLSSNTTLTLNSFDDLNTFNASGSTGGLTVNLGAPDELASATFGSGNDIVTIDTSSLAAATSNLAIDLGAGNDVINLTAASNPTAATVNITLGAGSDTVAVASLANVTSAAAFDDDLVTIVDFNAAQDVLDLSALVGGRDVLVNTELANISAAATLSDALALAAAATTTGQYSVFNYDGDAYILNNLGGAGFDDGDGLIKVTGFSVEAITETNFVA